jgi:hypothetical protein
MDHSQHVATPEGRALTRLAVSATLHCLTGCAIGEVLGMIIGTALAGATCRRSPWRSGSRSCSATRSPSARS